MLRSYIMFRRCFSAQEHFIRMLTGCIRSKSSYPVKMNSTSTDNTVVDNDPGKQDKTSLHSVKPTSDPDVTLAEAEVKRKMVGYQSVYGKAMVEAEPEDEAAVLEYYVRKAQGSLDEMDESIEYEVLTPEKKLFFRMVDLWIQDAGEVRRGHREFIQVSLNNLERFNVQHEPNAYLKILQCYPQSVHTGMQRGKWFAAAFQDKILDHELGVKLFAMMRKYEVVPTDEFYDKSMTLFGKYSRASSVIRSLLFWYPRLTQFIRYPVSNIMLEKMSRPEIALHALRQAIPSLDAKYHNFAVLEHAEPSDLDDNPESLNSILSIQSPGQISSLQNHDVSQPVFVEGPFSMYFKEHRIQYYILRADPTKKEETRQNYELVTDKEWWEKFYGKDFSSSRKFQGNDKLYEQRKFFPTLNFDEENCVVPQFKERNQIKEVCDDVLRVEGKVYGMAATDVRSIDALKSWIYGLESSNPILSQITVFFNEKRSFLTDGFKSAKRD